MRDTVIQLLTIIAVALGALCSSWLMALVGGGWRHGVLGYVGWALMPYAVLAAILLCVRLFRIDQSVQFLSAWASIFIALGGPLLYFDAVFVNVDAQGPLVLLMISALQLFSIFTVMATISVLGYLARQKSAHLLRLTSALVKSLHLLVPAALGCYGLVSWLQYADLPTLSQAQEVDFFIRNHLERTGALPTSALLLQRFPNANRQQGWFIYTDDKQYLTLQYPVRWWNSQAIGHAKTSEFTATPYAYVLDYHYELKNAPE